MWICNGNKHDNCSQLPQKVAWQCRCSGVYLSSRLRPLWSCMEKRAMLWKRRQPREMIIGSRVFRILLCHRCFLSRTYTTQGTDHYFMSVLIESHLHDTGDRPLFDVCASWVAPTQHRGQTTILCLCFLSRTYTTQGTDHYFMSVLLESHLHDTVDRPLFYVCAYWVAPTRHRGQTTILCVLLESHLHNTGDRPLFYVCASWVAPTRHREQTTILCLCFLSRTYTTQGTDHYFMYVLIESHLHDTGTDHYFMSVLLESHLHDTGDRPLFYVSASWFAPTQHR